MLGVMEMKVVEGQDYSNVLLITLLYFLLVRSSLWAQRSRRSCRWLLSRLSRLAIALSRPPLPATGRRTDDEPGHVQDSARSRKDEPFQLRR